MVVQGDWRKGGEIFYIAQGMAFVASFKVLKYEKAVRFSLYSARNLD